MVKKFLSISIAICLLIGINSVIAGKPDFVPPKDSSGKNLSLPENSIQVAENIYYLGKAKDPQSGKMVEGYAYIHFKDNPAKPDEPLKPDKTSTCYKFLSNSARWRWLEAYIFDSTNTKGLNGENLRAGLTMGISTWETAADYDIIGSEIGGIVDGADLENPDEKNEIYFTNIYPDNIIAVTIVWGIFSGPPFQRSLIEWDQAYNQADFNWSEDCESEDCTNKMDFENIATHELGHAVGLGDLYAKFCSEQTMYGYADFDETIKRTLEAGDILGISTLY